MPEGERFIMRQPREMRQDIVEAWMDHLWNRQTHILETGSAEWVFRFTIGKDTKGGSFTSHYNPDFIRTYAESQNVYLGSSNIVPLPARRTRGTTTEPDESQVAPDEEEVDTQPPVNDHIVQYDNADDTLPSDVFEEEDVDPDVNAVEEPIEGEEFGGDDEDVEMEADEPPRVVTPVDLTRITPSPPPTPLLGGLVRGSTVIQSQPSQPRPTLQAGLGVLPAPSLDFLQLFEDNPPPAKQVVDPSHDDPNDKAPSWAKSSLQKRYMYLSSLSTNEWYRDIVSWYHESQVSFEYHISDKDRYRLTRIR